MQGRNLIRYHALRAYAGDDSSSAWLKGHRASLTPDTPPVERAWSLMGAVCVKRNRAYHDPELVELLQLAKTLITHDDDPELWRMIHNEASTCYIEQGDWYLALVELLSALQHQDHTGDLARTLSSLGWLLVQLGQYCDALPYIERALELAEGIGRFTDTYSDKIEAQLGMGDLDGAQRTLSELDALDLSPNARAHAKADMTRARVAHALGRYDRVLALTHSPPSSELLLSDERAVVHAVRSAALFARGRHEGANDAAALGMRTIEHHPYTPTYSLLATTRARALAALGRTDELLELMLEIDSHQREQDTAQLGGNVVRLVSELQDEVHHLRHVELVSSNTAYKLANARLESEIVARSEAEKQARHALALHAVGELADGVAHDLNNLLVVIYSCVGLLEEELDGVLEDITPLEVVRDIGITADRAAALVRRLMALSNQPSQPPRTVDLSSVANSMRTLLRQAVREEIDLAFDLHDTLLVRANGNELEQVVLNLALNAQEAIDGVGTITISTSLEDGRATLRVNDTGQGISPDLAERIFDPFFSTEGRAYSSGFGLAISRSVITRTNGTLTVESTPGQGSSFIISLPLLLRSPTPIIPQDAIAPNSATNAVTLLVVEDDDAVRSAAIRLLNILGHKTLAACDGLDGLETFMAHADSIDIVLSDVVMPRSSGIDLAHSLLASSDVPIILMTGYSEDERLGDLLKEPRLQLINKPFDLKRLRNAIQVAIAALQPPP